MGRPGWDDLARETQRGLLTLRILHMMRRRRTQKKTAMTPVPTRITISVLTFSSEPEWAEKWKGCP